MFCAFAWGCPNRKMRKIRPTGLMLTGIRCNGWKLPGLPRIPRTSQEFPWTGEIQKGDGRKGTGQKNVINCRKSSKIVVPFYAEFYDDLWCFMSMEQSKMLPIVVDVVNCCDVCRRLSWHFFPVPFPPSPFGFRRLVTSQELLSPRISSAIQGFLRSSPEVPWTSREVQGLIGPM